MLSSHTALKKQYYLMSRKSQWWLWWLCTEWLIFLIRTYLLLFPRLSYPFTGSIASKILKSSWKSHILHITNKEDHWFELRIPILSMASRSLSEESNLTNKVQTTLFFDIILESWYRRRFVSLRHTSFFVLFEL